MRQNRQWLGWVQFSPTKHTGSVKNISFRLVASDFCRARMLIVKGQCLLLKSEYVLLQSIMFPVWSSFTHSVCFSFTGAFNSATSHLAIYHSMQPLMCDVALGFFPPLEPADFQPIYDPPAETRGATLDRGIALSWQRDKIPIYPMTYHCLNSNCDKIAFTWQRGTEAMMYSRKSLQNIHL